MAKVFARTGLTRLLTELVGGSSLENWQIGLFSSDIPEDDKTTIATYLSGEANFAGYARLTLTRTISGTTWSTPTLATPSGSPAWTPNAAVAATAFGSAPRTWTNLGTTPATVYGYFVMGSSSGVLIFSERFSSPWIGTNRESIEVTPTLEFTMGW